ncbi:MAG: UvrD-helicase domain-containing protein [Spirochaetales bacterium]|nr:UvrD-helicase domain-containing protein [Spirochaetales bacterium]
MSFVADLHIHSRYSISTSPQLVPEYLELWAAIKGITVVGTGDFTHPKWLAELEEKLEPVEAEPGLYRLRPELRREALERGEAEGLPLPPAEAQPTRFLLTAEISNIYRRDGRTRKVHNLILAPDLPSARRLQVQLDRRGNVASDGRPILGMDSRDLLEITLEHCPGAVFVPAHIWTPWFSVLGAKSGFDRVQDCYADLAGHIRAVETGLSSDPPMNWLCSALDRYTLISNSDAHSPEKLGREANLFATALSYPAMAAALSAEDRDGFAGTVEFFPQEGKYHFDGHRKCGVCWDPLETLRRGGLCPVCGKPVTTGVLSRVAQLADRDCLPDPSTRRPFHSLIPLKEILGEIHGVGPGSREIARAYAALVNRAGSEFALLLQLPVAEVERLGGELLGEAVRRMRAAEVRVEPGFDGQYGAVRLFAPGEIERRGSRELQFQPPAPGEEAAGAPPPPVRPRPLVSFDVAAFRREREAAAEPPGGTEQPGGAVPGRPPSAPQSGLNGPQARAAAHGHGPALVLAGPGTGKTRTLAARLAALVGRQGVDPAGVLAVTFTNKAAGEMRQRLAGLLGPSPAASAPTICTFHALGRSLLSDFLPDTGRDAGFPLLDQEDRTRILARLPGCPPRQAAAFSKAIGAAKERLQLPVATADPRLAELWTEYHRRLEELGAFDLEDLLFEPVRRLTASPPLAALIRERYPWVLVDEYQDINEAQYRLVRLLAPGPSANLWAVGDPDQAIYGFRGAEVGFIRRFLDDYPGAAVYRLSESFRCSDTILRASGQLLTHGSRLTAGAPWAVGAHEALASALPGPGVRIRIAEHASEASEAEAVARTIEAMIGGLRFFSMDSEITEGQAAEGIESLGDFAVLCRIGRQMQALERAFRDHAIPYQKAEAEPFWQREPASSLLRLARALRLPDAGGGAEELLPQLPPSGREALQALARQAGVGWVDPAAAEQPRVQELLARLAELCPPEDREGREVLERLLEHSGSFGRDLDAFLAHAALGSGADGLRELPAERELVSLLTLHAAKGLEFACVFIVGCEEGLLPYSLLPGQSTDPEEERRLFYVGMTRARRYLHLSHARRRRLFGRELRLPRSRFLDAIEAGLTEMQSPDPRRPPRRDQGQMELF